MRSSTAAILFTKWLKAVAICASSSLPLLSRRTVRSPSPEAMSSSASRTMARRRSWRLTATDTRATAATRHSAVMAAATCNRWRSGAVASARSMPMASTQGVPSTLTAYSICSASPMVTFALWPCWVSCSIRAGVRAGAMALMGLSTRSAWAWARTLPWPSSRKAKLLGVG